MFELSGTRIRLTQGDTGILTVKAKKTDHVFTDADKVVFTVKRRGGAGIIMERLLTPEKDGTVQISFLSDMTDTMKPDQYDWDIRYCMNATVVDGRVTDADEVVTPMLPGVFEIVKAVGRV